MRQFLSLLSLVVTSIFLSSGPALASDPERIKNALWRAIDDADFGEAEAVLRTAHLNQMSGHLSHDELRSVFTVFDTNNPEVARFAEAWVSAYPESPYANSGLAWVLIQTSWVIRGDGLAREIYPAALREFRRMQEEAWQHAVAAFDKDPTLIPATDAIIGLANPVGRRGLGLATMHKVMDQDPNRGTLQRGLFLTNPGWGGKWSMAEHLCQKYAPQVEWPEGDATEYCLLYAGGSYHAPSQFDRVYKVLNKGRYPSLDYMRLERALHPTATRQEAEFAREYLSRDDVTEVMHAENYDLHVANRYGFNFLAETHLRRAQEEARAKLQRDPYNPKLLRVLLRSVSTRTRTAAGVSSSTVSRPDPEDQKEYMRRILVASPYVSRHWLQYAQALYQGRPENIVKDEPYRINAIVYSDHDPEHLFGYAFEKWRLLDMLERLDAESESAAFQQLTKSDQAKALEEIEKWIHARDSLDIDRDLKCPMMRAYRLHLYLCRGSDSPDCAPMTQQAEMLEIVKSDVNRRRVCTGVMGARPWELFYEPLDIDLTASGG